MIMKFVIIKSCDIKLIRTRIITIIAVMKMILIKIMIQMMMILILSMMIEYS